MTNPDDSGQSGAEFRAKAEAAFAKVKALEGQLAATVASGHKFVKPEDLAGIDPAELPTKAAEISAARAAEREAQFKESLAERGLSEEQINQMIESKATPTPVVNEDDPAYRMASLGEIPGMVPSRTIANGENLWGLDRIRAGVNKKTS